MKIQLLLCTVTAMSVMASLAKADTYSTVTETQTSDPMPIETRETRTTTVESSPTTVVKEQPIVVTPPATVTTPINNETVIVKKHSHHLLNLGVIKVF